MHVCFEILISLCTGTRVSKEIKYEPPINFLNFQYEGTVKLKRAMKYQIVLPNKGKKYNRIMYFFCNLWHQCFLNAKETGLLDIFRFYTKERKNNWKCLIAIFSLYFWEYHFSLEHTNLQIYIKLLYFFLPSCMGHKKRSSCQ